MSGDQYTQNIQGDGNFTAQGKDSTFVQGDNNQINQGVNGEQLSVDEVVQMLAFLEEKIQNSTALPESAKENSTKRLEAAKVEAIAKSLKRVNETLNEAGKTTEEVK